MRRLSVASIAVVSAVALTQVALAADMPVKAPAYKAPIAAPYYDWSEFYVGGHVGYIWGRTRVEEDGVVTEPNASTDGVIGGALAGYNWQNGPWVLDSKVISAGPTLMAPARSLHRWLYKHPTLTI